MKDGKLRISREEGRRNGLACCDNPERLCLNDPDRCAVDSALSIRQKDGIVKSIERTFASTKRLRQGPSARKPSPWQPQLALPKRTATSEVWDFKAFVPAG